MDVSIIIVNYNTLTITKKCIDSIWNHTKDVDFEIILVDNNSCDGSVDFFKNYKNIKFIYNHENYGFAKANNRGVRIATGKYVFFLNSDTIILNNAIKLYFDFFEKYHDSLKIGALACYLYDENLEITNSYMKFSSVSNVIKSQINIISKNLFKFKILKNNIINYKGTKDILEVDFVIGAAMMVDKKVFWEFNGFDEDYFMYSEEKDLQKRMRKKGYKSYIFSKPEIIHLEGQSSLKNHSYLEYNLHYFKSMFIYFKKNHSVIKYFLLKFLIIPLLLRFVFMKKYPFKIRKNFILTILKT